ncbi:MAG TPA: MFS transporter [Alphaproteobacteria bacterium]|nr:MFS transporter [Alphaproteobacteria bacterium]
MIGSASILRRPGLVPLAAVLVLSNAAEQFALLALLWLATESGAPPLALGAVVLCNRLPAVLAAPAIGRLLDRLAPRRLIVLDNLGRALCLVAAVALMAAQGPGLPLILGLAALLGLPAALTCTGVRVVVPRLVPAAELPVANGVIGIGDHLPYLLGPPLAGLMLAATSGALALLVPAAALVVAALLALGLPAAAGRPASAYAGAAPEPAVRWLGFEPLWRHPALRALLILTTAYFFAYGPLEPALPLFVRDALRAGPEAFGLLWGAFGLGAFLGLVTVKPLARLRPGVVNAAGAVLWGVLLLPVALAETLLPALVCIFLGAFVWAPYAAIEVSVIQRLVPAGQLGAVLAARRALLIAAMPAGAALGGALLELVSAPAVIALSSAACIVVGGACLAVPSLRAVPPPGRP